MRTITFLFVVLFGISGIACKNKKEITKAPKVYRGNKKERPAISTELLIKIETTPCFGKCPVYTMSIKKNGAINYTGRKFVTHIGDYIGRLNTVQVDSLTQKLRDIGYMSFQDEYDQNVTDLPTTITTVLLDGQEKSVKARIGFPEELRQLHKYLYQLSERIELESTTDEPEEDEEE